MEQVALIETLRGPQVSRIFDVTEVEGDAVRFVGGCVRDALLNRTIKDIDLATTAEPPLILARLQAAKIKAIPTGIEHGTITAVVDGMPVEVTTLRKDVETDGRRAVVAFTNDWREDAVRRDLTMNALSMDRDGNVYDYFTGIEDAHAGRIRFVGNAEQRIREDILRILRFFRFYAHYGKGKAPDKDALDACIKLCPLISELSAERVRQELLRLLEAEDPASTIAVMQEAGVWSALNLGDADIRSISALDSHDPILRLTAVLGFVCTPEKRAPEKRAPEKRAPDKRAPDKRAPDKRAWEKPSLDTLAERLRLSKNEGSRLKAWRARLNDPPLDEAALRRALYFYGSDAVGGAAALALSSTGQHRDAWRAAKAAAEIWQKPKFPLSGEDFSIPQGPALGAALKEVEAWWIDAAFKPDREACLEKAREIEGRVT